jgi:hypothetical protein
MSYPIQFPLKVAWLSIVKWFLGYIHHKSAPACLFKIIGNRKCGVRNSTLFSFRNYSIIPLSVTSPTRFPSG